MLYVFLLINSVVQVKSNHKSASKEARSSGRDFASFKMWLSPRVIALDECVQDAMERTESAREIKAICFRSKP